MPVTEIAIARLRRGYDMLDLLETLMQCQEVQDEWMSQNQPHTLHKADNGDRALSSMYIQVDGDVPYLLITAPWESPQAHREWIKSSENQLVFGRLSTFLEPGPNSVQLFHTETAGKLHSQLRGKYLLREQFHVYRLFVDDPSKREEMGRRYLEVEKSVHIKNPDQVLWGGWRIEKPSDGKEELVVFRCNKVPEESMQGLLSIATETEQYNFKHVTL